MRARAPWLWIAVLAAIKFLIHIATARNYGWHIDELYFVESSRHLDWGFVDYPPVVPLLARLDQAVFPGSLVALRGISALAGAAIVVVTALIARELGASPRGQAWAALMALLSPMFIGANYLFHTTTFDELCWAIALFLFARLLRTDDLRLWLWLGVVIGIGLETKLTIAALPVVMFLALLATPRRRMLLSPWPWAGAAIALAIFVPNLVWQATRGWITVQYALEHRGHTDGPIAYWLQQLLFVDPLFVVPGIAGLVALRKDPRLAPAVYVVVGVELVFFAAGGKSYYAGPAYPLIYAAGAIWLDARLQSRLTVSLSVAAAVLLTLLLLPIGLPVLSERQLVESGLWKVRSDFAAELGGADLARATATAYDSVPVEQRAGTMIIAQYYGEAGPINLYGSAYGLPKAVSPHLTYWYWAPPRMDPQTAVLVGFTPEVAGSLFSSCRVVDTVKNSYGIKDDFAGDQILVCSQPRRPLWKAWPSLQILD